MTRFKDFGAGNVEKVEPLSFALHGETFNCVPRVQGKLLLDLVTDANDESKSAQIITRFFDQVLQDESLVRFNALLADKVKVVDVETLAEITGWLMEEYTNRPEKQPEA